MELRQDVEDHVKYKVGNGETISAWYDRWTNQQALAKSIRRRDIHLDGFNEQSKLCEVVDVNGWKWPYDWRNKYEIIQNMEVPTLSEEPDVPVWITNNGREVKFSTKNVWMDMRHNETEVVWSKVVWHSHCIPKHSFVLWLAMKHKLLTQDKLLKWYPNKSLQCPMCKTVEDSHDHLFFQCKYSEVVWNEIKNMARINYRAGNWDSWVNELSCLQNNTSIWNVIKKLCFAASVYHIWQERNCRIFRQE